MRLRVSPTSRHEDERGFTLIELLVVIVILGVLSAVVVFAVRGAGDKGSSAAIATDADTVRTAQEAYCAQKGSYGSVADLKAAGFLSDVSTLTDAALVKGPCGTDPAKSGFMLGFKQPNGGSPASIDSLTLATTAGDTAARFGWPNPLMSARGPGNGNSMRIFDTLIWKDATGNPLPWLASEVPTTANGGISADGLTWKFKIRDNVKWQDDTIAAPHVLTVADVLFTFGYYKTGGATGRNATIRDSVTGFAADPADPTHGVVVTLNKPLNTFMSSIGQGLQILPQSIWSKAAYSPAPSATAPGTILAEQFVGTGAYILQNPTSYDPISGTDPTPGVQAAVYNGNPNFFLGAPYVKQLRYITVTDPVAALNTGQVSAGGIGNEESVDDATLASVAGLDRVSTNGGSGWNRAFLFNMTVGFPYNNVAFRQALALTIDRQDLLQRILGGRGDPVSMGGLVPANPFLAPGLPSYTRNVEQAKLLLDSIGIIDPDGAGPAKRQCSTTVCQIRYPTGASTVVNTTSGAGVTFTPRLVTTSPNSNSNVTVDIITQYLADIGLDSAQVNNRVDADSQNGRYGIFMTGYGNLTTDPDSLRGSLSSVYTTNTAGTGPISGNTSFQAVYGWNASASSSSPYAVTPSPLTGLTHAKKADEFTKLADLQLIEPDQAKRKQMLHRMQELVAADVPRIGLYSPVSYQFFPKGGFTPWYVTPGGGPQPGFGNKHTYITGKQFGLPAGF